MPRRPAAQPSNSTVITSRPTSAAGEESFEMVVPAMKVRDFHFSEATKF